MKLSDSFYRALEDKFRGSKEEIKNKLKIYLPIIKNLKGKKAIDLGCGRGEFLDLLTENGIQALGVDTKKEMVDNKNVVIEDALEFLKKQKDKSVSLISSFHMIEHVEFDYLYRLIKESFRVLDDDGILILETPNPENIRVACEYFYFDPTHKRPVPKGLLKFLLEYEGFYVNIWQLNSKKDLNIKDIFNAVAFDYCAIATKKPNNFIYEGVNLDMVLDEAKNREKSLEKTVELLMAENLKNQQKIETLRSQISALNHSVNNINNTIAVFDKWINTLIRNYFIRVFIKLQSAVGKIIRPFFSANTPKLNKRALEIYKELKRKNG